MSREAIPAELRRAVLVESGHRCAIPRCAHSDVDVHHIIPWEVCRSHEYENLIALCPNCHRRAHNDEIDRKSLREYKARLIAGISSAVAFSQNHPAIEIKRRIAEPPISELTAGFDFEYPDFTEPGSKIVSRNLEAWGEELLQGYRSGIDGLTPEILWERRPLVWLRGRYEVCRRDSFVISLRYSLERYPFGAAHRSTQTRVQNFLLRPFRPITIESIVAPWAELSRLSELVQREIFRKYPAVLNDESAKRGTSADYSNFSLFTVGEYGLTFYFEEYQIACYAMGRLSAYVDFYSLKDVIPQEIYDILVQHDGI